ncbi:hypothetical protein VE01_00922 [Pseudogymnoascus verrucosus]|uniref:Uncharacterized protein n=1 Tax=Pseudogymnoascus verrucosus TaxID=342668 RepID=A0A2P2SWG3_9PEZI|nr:uncharacterized protein VE01_00922 [Pseudogymnoascus verrucosus]OBU01198.1 hypothetical protein VE01_00922 [Pseudogymnoascus verrucosus]
MATAPKTIGRGGAGNFRSPTDQRPAETPDTPDTRTVNPQLSSLRSGRGGAGNTNPSSSSSSTPSTGPSAGKSPAARLDAVIVGEAPKSAAKEVVYGGRGGAGNWKVGREEEEERRRVEEEGRKREVEEMVRREVEGGLVMPGRVYRGVGRGEEEEEEG